MPNVDGKIRVGKLVFCQFLLKIIFLSYQFQKYTYYLISTLDDFHVLAGVDKLFLE